MSLLQDVLRSHTNIASLDRTLASVNIAHDEQDDDFTLVNSSRPTTRPGSPSVDDEFELINVTSAPGTPTRSRTASRAPSPTRGASTRPLPGPLHLEPQKSADPLKAFPTDISQRIFSRLSIADLSRCARVSKKWNRSQTINYVWFRHYRKENFHDDSLPPGKWTKRESKQNWRTLYLQSSNNRSPPPTSLSRGSGYESPSLGSGYQTPRELKEEKWRAEEAASKLGKVEMRGIYKELGGRKSRGKTKLGSSGVRDKGGWEVDNGW